LHYKVINANIQHGFKRGFLLWSKFIMLVLLHLAKHLAPTQMQLGSTYVVTKVFGVFRVNYK
jgi:hypothetical protein